MLIDPESSTILVVDDDAFVRKMLSGYLNREQYHVIEASNGAEGLALYNDLHPDLVLLDAVMPVMDGFEFCAQLQLLPDRQRVPILMITGLEDETSVEQAFSLGAVDYVTKPIHWAVLRQRVRRLIQQSHLQYKLKSANLELQRLVALNGLTQPPECCHFDEYFL